MIVKEFINTATDTVHVMTPSPLHGEYHPRTKKNIYFKYGNRY